MNLQKEISMEEITVETKTVGKIRVPVIDEKIRKMLEKARGPIPYPLSNDRAIRGVISFSAAARRGYAAILLGIPEEEIEEVEVLNPISFGENPGKDKKTEEDIRLRINGEISLDSEMQNFGLDVNNRRYLLYLCRNVNELEKGQDYDQLRPDVFVELANYSRHTAHPEFMSRYRILNLETHDPFFENDLTFAINVINLKNTDLADESDKSSGRVLLAQLIEVKTWEELRELAHRSPFAMEVGCIMAAANADTRERISLEAARRDAELKLTLNNRREKAEQRTKEAEQRTKEAEQRTKEAEQRTKEAEQRTEEAEQRAAALEKRIQELEAQLRGMEKQNTDH